jgi:SPP1 family predicted phage head-tail adaptor
MAEIGPKRHRLTIERRSTAENDFGQPSDAWSTVATIWGRVRALSGRELATAAEIRPETSLRVEIRYRSDLTPEDRFDFNGRKLRILGLWDPEERRRELYADCCEWRGATDGG